MLRRRRSGWSLSVSDPIAPIVETYDPIKHSGIGPWIDWVPPFCEVGHE
jgi:hypothetical protein